MSKIQVDTIVNKEDNGAPNFPSGVTVTGVITATSFSGSIIGSATGISGSPDITVGSIDASNLNATGIVTAISFSGSASNLTGITGKAAAMSIVFG